jgi:hypothetical protein
MAAAHYQLRQHTDSELSRLRQELEHELANGHSLSTQARAEITTDLQAVENELADRKRERAIKPGQGREFPSVPAYRLYSD